MDKALSLCLGAFKLVIMFFLEETLSLTVFKTACTRTQQGSRLSSAMM